MKIEFVQALERDKKMNGQKVVTHKSFEFDFCGFCSEWNG
jgi:hypothetical protein